MKYGKLNLSEKETGNYFRSMHNNVFNYPP